MKQVLRSEEHGKTVAGGTPSRLRASNSAHRDTTGFPAGAREPGEVREDTTFSTWLTVISIDEALKCLRQHRVHGPTHVDNVDAASLDSGESIPV